MRLRTGLFLSLAALCTAGCAAAPGRATSSGPDTPGPRLLEALLAGPVALPEGALAGRVAEAAHAFTRADFGAARRLALEALQATPAAQAGCDTQGPLGYLAWKASRLGGGEVEEALEALRASCLTRALPAEARGLQTFLALLVELEGARGAGWSLDGLPDGWVTRRGRARALDELRARAAPLTGARAELIQALLSELEASFRPQQGICDEAGEQARVADLARARADFVRLGREDLAPWLGLEPPVDAQGQLRPEAVRAYREALDGPGRQWLRSSGLTALLGALAYQAVQGGGAELAQPLCAELLAETERRMLQDTGPGALDRSTDLLTGLFGVTSACPDRRPIQALTQRLLERASQDERGRVAVLGTLVSLGGNLFQSLMSGQGNLFLAQALELQSSLEAILPTLGASPDEQALAGVLYALTAAGPFLQGQPEQGLARVVKAEAALEALPSPPPQGATQLVRLAPGFRLLAGYGRALAEQLLGRAEASQASLARQAARLAVDVPLLMQALGVARLEGDATRLAGALHALAAHLLAAGPDLAALRAQVAEARPRPPAQGDAWDLGLLVGHALLWDVVGLLDEGPGRPPAMAEARAELDQAVRLGLTWYAPGDPGADYLRLLPLGHQLAERALASAEEETWRAVLAAGAEVRPELERLLAELAPSHPAAGRVERLAQEGGLPELLMEALWVAREAGFAELAAGEPQAVAMAQRRLGEVDEALGRADRADLRIMLGLAAALTHHGAGRTGDAVAWLARAQRAIAGTELEGHPYLFSLIAAALHDRAGDQAGALTALRAALAAGEQARTCGKTHPVEALHLPEAVLLWRLGRPEEASAALARHRDALGRGAGGEGKLRLLYKYRQDRTVFQVDITAEMVNMLLPTRQGGAFQLGLGFQSSPADRELLTFEGSDVGHRRWDRVLQGQLLEAALALGAGEDARADTALREARASLARLQHGQISSLGAFEAGGLEASREGSTPELLFWVGVMAMLRGHTDVGEELEAAARAALGELSAQAVLPDGAPPVHLRGVAALAPLEPVVALWAGGNPRLTPPGAELLASLERLAAGAGGLALEASPAILGALSAMNRGDPGGMQAAVASAPRAAQAHPALRRLGAGRDLRAGLAQPGGAPGPGRGADPGGLRCRGGLAGRARRRGAGGRRPRAGHGASAGRAQRHRPAGGRADPGTGLPCPVLPGRRRRAPPAGRAPAGGGAGRERGPGPAGAGDRRGGQPAAPWLAGGRARPGPRAARAPPAAVHRRLRLARGAHAPAAGRGRGARGGDRAAPDRGRGGRHPRALGVGAAPGPEHARLPAGARGGAHDRQRRARAVPALPGGHAARARPAGRSAELTAHAI